MPDSETYKLIINSGMFGLWLLLTVWVLFYGAPMLKEFVEKVLAAFKEELSKERSVCAENHREQMKEHKENASENRELHADTRHAVNSFAHAAGLKAAIEDAKARKPPKPE